MSNTSIDLKDFRQPMVTSLGVMLGFLVGFLGQWVSENTFALNELSDYCVFLGCFIGATLLFLALFRMLKPNVPVESSHTFYQRTLSLYMTGILVAFLSILLSAFI